MNKSTYLTEIGAFGSPFEHDITSCTGIPPKNHKWIFNTVPENGTVVYMDHDIMGGFESTATYKYLWMCESRAIVPHQHQILRKNFSIFADCYRIIFTHDDDLLSIGPPFAYAPPAANHTWIRAPKIYRKSKLCSIVSSGKSFCDGHRYRNEIVSLILEKNKFIEFYGRHHRPFNTKEEVLVDYMFSITIENEIYDDYYTEKLIDCFATGTVPIYMGSTKIFSKFDDRGVIRILKDSITNSLDFSYLSADLYNTLLPFVEHNFGLLATHSTSDDFIHRRIELDIGGL